MAQITSLESPMYCPVCDGQLYLLGVLGNLAHLRCVCCGSQTTAPAEDLDLDTEE